MTQADAVTLRLEEGDDYHAPWICNSCGHIYICRNANYCPGCGNLIDWENSEEDNDPT